MCRECGVDKVGLTGIVGGIRPQKVWIEASHHSASAFQSVTSVAQVCLFSDM